jgi:hypothetical protein
VLAGFGAASTLALLVHEMLASLLEDWPNMKEAAQSLSALEYGIPTSVLAGKKASSTLFLSAIIGAAMFTLLLAGVFLFDVQLPFDNEKNLEGVRGRAAATFFDPLSAASGGIVEQQPASQSAAPPAPPPPPQEPVLIEFAARARPTWAPAHRAKSPAVTNPRSSKKASAGSVQKHLTAKPQKKNSPASILRDPFSHAPKRTLRPAKKTNLIVKDSLDEKHIFILH